MKTVVPLSGGLDSATVLAGCVPDGQVLAIGFDYGQQHSIELQYASKLANHYDVRFETMKLPPLPKINDVVYASRNLIFASLAIARAQAGGYNRVVFGCNASDWQEFPDCRPDFWRNVERCAEAYGVIVLTPLIYMSKKDIVDAARKLGVPIDLTWSCYNPNGYPQYPCHECLACKTRAEALA